MSDEPNRPSLGNRPKIGLPVVQNHGSSLSAWVQLARTYTKVQQRMSRVFSQNGITSPQFDVLATLHRGEGVMQQELAARLLVTKGNICGVLDRMEATGWIERRADPDDRRVNAIFLTDAGREVFEQTIPEHHAVLYEIMESLPNEDLKRLQGFLKTLEEAIEK